MKFNWRDTTIVPEWPEQAGGEERIARALERIADALERGNGHVQPSLPTTQITGSYVGFDSSKADYLQKLEEQRRLGYPELEKE